MDQFIDYQIEGQKDGIRLALRDSFHVIEKTDWLHGVNRSDMSQQFIRFEPLLVRETMSIVKCHRRDGEGNESWVIHITVLKGGAFADTMWNKLNRMVQERVDSNYPKEQILEDLFKSLGIG